MSQCRVSKQNDILYYDARMDQSAIESQKQNVLSSLGIMTFVCLVMMLML